MIAGSDHGDYAGDYGLVEKWPSGLESCLTHVPLIARMPGGAPIVAPGTGRRETLETPPCGGGLERRVNPGLPRGEPGPPARIGPKASREAESRSLPMPPHVTTPHERAPLPGGTDKT